MNRFLFAALLFAGGCAPQNTTSTASATASAPLVTPVVAPVGKDAPRQLSWTILKEFPHDPTAFTEGLLWHNGALYESTGMEGQSKLRRVDLQSGQVLKNLDLPAQLFGEGLALAGNKLYQLTWQSKVGFVYDATTFKPLAKFNYANEGWGLTFDGTDLIQSDGTDTLTWRDPKDFATKRTLKVTRFGQPLANLNELEWIGGKIWANVWQTNDIVIIDPKTGHVTAQLDMNGLLKPADKSGNEDVLNGIAYDSTNKRILITGKNWPKLFWIGVEGMGDA